MRFLVCLLALFLAGCGSSRHQVDPEPEASVHDAGLTDTERQFGGIAVGRSVDGRETVVLPNGSYYLRSDLAGAKPG